MNARLLPVVLLLLAGCGGIGVRPADRPALGVGCGDSLPRPGKVSARTEQLLRRYDLDSLYPGDLPLLSERLLAEAKKEPLPGLRADLVHLIRTALALRLPAHVIVNNRAEGSAPLTIVAVAKLLIQQMRGGD